jgi:hypothetical protein
VIADPPLLVGAWNVSAIEFVDAIAVVSVGAPGVVSGVTAETVDQTPRPTEFEAAIWNE